MTSINKKQKRKEKESRQGQGRPTNNDFNEHDTCIGLTQTKVLLQNTKQSC